MLLGKLSYPKFLHLLFFCVTCSPMKFFLITSWKCHYYIKICTALRTDRCDYFRNRLWVYFLLSQGRSRKQVSTKWQVIWKSQSQQLDWKYEERFIVGVDCGAMCRRPVVHGSASGARDNKEIRTQKQKKR